MPQGPATFPSSLVDKLSLVDGASFEWRLACQLMSVTNPRHLGIGRDVREGRTYRSLRLLHVWKIDDVDMREVYNAKLRITQRQISELQEDGITSTRVTTKLDSVAESFNLDQDANEKVLLHGTKAEHVRTILHNGLNERLSSSRGLFGQGIYTAEDIEKVDQYCTRAWEQDFEDLHALLYQSQGLPEPPRHVLYCFVVFVVLGMPVFTRDGHTSLSSGGPLFASAHQRELSPVFGSSPPVPHHSLIVEVGGKVKRHREFLVTSAERTYLPFLIAYVRERD